MKKSEGVFNVAVEAVILKGRKILITKRSDKRSHAPGEWEMITGRLKQNETFEEALNREVYEETKLVINVIRPFNTFHFYRGKEKAEHQGVSFLCKYKSGDVVLDPNEQIDFKWVSIREAKKLVTDKSILRSLSILEKI